MFVLENMGKGSDSVSLELLKYFLGWSQPIPDGPCDLEAGSEEALDSAVNHSSAWQRGAPRPAFLSSVAPSALFVKIFQLPARTGPGEIHGDGKTGFLGRYMEIGRLGSYPLGFHLPPCLDLAPSPLVPTIK